VKKYSRCMREISSPFPRCETARPRTYLSASKHRSAFRFERPESIGPLIQRKHPDVADKAEEVQGCLRRPSLVRRSVQDPAVYLFYAPLPPYHLVVVIRRLNGDGFVITSYLTTRIKGGVEIWPTSE
jgi:hypothetical protein